MTEYIIDAYAWIEYLEGSTKGEKVKKIIETSNCFTSAVTLAEVVSKAKRTNKDPQVAFDAVALNSHILRVDEEIAKKTGLIHAEQKLRKPSFGLADAFILAQRDKKQRVLTGDPHFKEIENVEFMK
ncbi:MAG: PIN domain-containing protein [Candidatus Diapherotrites archaeon]|nr:PIN domain-containing protein [Candidatus Diapherotrites archaeon]